MTEDNPRTSATSISSPGEDRRLNSLPKPVGRRLDFLLQRDAARGQRIGARKQDAGISQRVVAMKVKARAELQNVE
jgi:uncharacterized protein YicC (UPF0701 family)